jgi:hypothetical protein
LSWDILIEVQGLLSGRERSILKFGILSTSTSILRAFYVALGGWKAYLKSGTLLGV